MSKVTILAGDFPRGTGHFTFRNFTLPGDEEHFLCETVCVSQIEFINTATPRMALLLNKNPELAEEIQLELEEKMRLANDGEVFFMIRLADQRRFIAETDQHTYNNIKRSIDQLSLSTAPYFDYQA